MGGGGNIISELNASVYQDALQVWLRRLEMYVASGGVRSEGL